MITEKKVTPLDGFGGDFFNFSINITDHDNDILQVFLFIQGESGSPFIMQELDILDLITSDGKSFFYNVSLSKGTYNYNFSVFDFEDTNQTAPTILVVKNNPPVITTIDVISTLEDAFYSVDYDYLDLDGDSIAWNLDTNASWLNFDALLGRIYGTPNSTEPRTTNMWEIIMPT
jgi:hypothetical protein